ncbi:hypothetical protein Tco_1163902 [Tanacetum coccineum]
MVDRGSGVGVDTAYPRYWIWRIGVSWSRDHARIHRIFLDGYGVLVVRIVIFKISSFKLQNARLLPIFTKYSEARIQLSVEQFDLRDDTDDEPEDQKLEAHYLYMEKIQEVSLDAADNSGPVFYAEPLQKVQNDDDNYNVFTNGREHPEQPESINDTYSDEHSDTNITIDSLDMSTNGVEADQDDADDLAKERDLLASLIDKLKCEIDDNKNHNKLLE